jgi:glycerate 2-kinase
VDFRDHQRHIDMLIQAALAAVEPGAAVRRFLQRDAHHLHVGNRTYELTQGRVFLIGAGKAAGPMAAAAAEILGDTLAAGVLITKHGFEQPHLPASLLFFHAGHPIPDEAGIQATTAATTLVSQATAADLVLCLISGGASALLTQPVIPLTDWQQLVDALLASGCTIQELNCVRKQLDQVKGGGLAHLAAPATCASLILSDVIGNPLDIIGSGPTTANAQTPTDALVILHRYHLSDQLPPATWQQITAYLQQQTTERPPAISAHNVIIGDVRQAAQAAAQAASKLGFATQVLTAQLEGEAREVGRVAAALAKDAPPNTCLILGGETTVRLKGNGRGGRNQEVALAAAIALDGQPNVVLASFSTDGDDGPTDAAGALVTGETAALARAHHLDPHDSLARNDSYPFFDQLGSLLRTGPTGTNVNDLVLILKYG